MIAIKPILSPEFSSQEERLQHCPLRTPLRITRIQGLSELVSRVESMGLSANRDVILLRKSKDSIVVKIGQTQLALRLSRHLLIFGQPV